MTASDNEFTHGDGVSLKEYFDSRFMALDDKIEAVEKLHAVMVENIAEATTLARIAMERRLDVMNGGRDELIAQASAFVTREELDAQGKGLNASIAAAGKGRVSWGVALAITFLTSVVLSLLVLVLTFALK